MTTGLVLKVVCPMGSQNVKRGSQNEVDALTFLIRYDSKKNGVLQSIVTGDETWILYVNTEIKEQSMQCMHTRFPSKPKKMGILKYFICIY